MTRLGFKTAIILVIVALMNLTATLPMALADDPSPRPDQSQGDRAQENPQTPATGPEIAGGGRAGTGAARSVDPVILRNTIIGLVFAGLLVASALNESQ